MTIDIIDTPVVHAESGPPARPLREFWSYFSANHGAVAGLVVIILLLILALLADIIAPHSPILTNSAAFLRQINFSGTRKYVQSILRRHQHYQPDFPPRN